MKKSIFFAFLLLCGIIAKAQYDGEVGTEGCKAISQNDERIISWATGVEVNRGFWDYGDERVVTYGESYMAIGKPDSTTTTAISLGEGGSALITFDRPIINGEGKDFVVFENAFSPSFLELAFVEISSDGINFFRFPNHSTAYYSDSSMSEGRTAEHYNNLAGKYELGWGVGFDITDIADNDLLDKNNIRFVRLIDVVNGVSTDSQGNIIYDGVSWPSYSQGFDLTGVGVINGGNPYFVADFENLVLNNNSFEIIDLNNYTSMQDSVYSKDYISGGLNFLGTLYYSWGYPMSVGFGLSNVSDTLSAINGNSEYRSAYYISAPMYAVEGKDKNYAVAYYDAWTENKHNIVKMANNQTFSPKGVYVSKSLAAYQDLEASVIENLYFKVVAKGYDAVQNQISSTEIYLYDFTNGIANLKDWRYFDLTPLGEVSQITFSVECAESYVSNYFCLDNFTYTSLHSTAIERVLVEDIRVDVYPNPVSEFVTIEAGQNCKLQMFDTQGREIKTMNLALGHNQINVSELQGTYILKFITSTSTYTKKLVVK